jgi:hypothetical protein
MGEKSKIILKKPDEAQIFVWEPIDGFSLEPIFSRTLWVQKENKIDWVVLIDVVDTNLDSERQTARKFFFVKNHFLSIKSRNSSRTSKKNWFSVHETNTYNRK